MASAQLHDPASRVRDAMIESQLMPCGVVDSAVVDAFAAVPREEFVAPDRRALAYVDGDQPLAAGRAMMAPLTLGRLVQAARVRPGERALVVGGATGYSAAILAAMGAAVTLLECDRELAELARARLSSWPAVTIVEGPLDGGAPAAAPFDLVLLDGAVETLPSALAAQLAPDGRAVMVLAGADRVHRVALCRPTGDSLSCDYLAETTAPLLPAFRKPEGFQF